MTESASDTASNTATAPTTTRIDVFSDVICPWCFIGKRRLERAMAMRTDKPVALRWRPFQLNPTMPAEGIGRAEYVTAKFGPGARAQDIYKSALEAGASEGLDLNFDAIMRTPNTTNAHRLILWAYENAPPESAEDKADLLVETLFRAYFFAGEDIGATDTLVRAAAQAGLDGDAARLWLDSDAGLAEIASEQQFAAVNQISGVPFFIFNDRYAVTGAQPPEAMLPLFDRAPDAA